jgi:hypothetical protein
MEGMCTDSTPAVTPKVSGRRTKLKPYTRSQPNRFCRLFAKAGDEAAASTEALVGLARSTNGRETPIPMSVRHGEPIGAAYTYFGQFIDHDLIRDTTTFTHAGLIEPEETENHRTPWLDLDSLYGGGPWSEEDENLYADDGVSFRLGDTTVNGEFFDVPLHDGLPQLADVRNNENIIVRQIHAIFLKLHNLAVQELAEMKLPAAVLFQKAEERVRWQYQWLVRHDYLRQICQPGIYRDIIEEGQRRIDWCDSFSIPVEFSQAAFRFGHSMVRESYILGREPSRETVQLHEMFCLGQRGALESRFAVDWRRSLVGPNTSMRIDTRIVPPLFTLPPDAIHMFVSTPTPHGPYELAVRTVLRGKAMKLPTGQEACGVICPEAMIFDRGGPITDGYDPWFTLRRLGLNESTPLWYYILLEAELQENGLKLGTLGSRLVAEVIEGSLRADPGSFLSVCGEKWTPPPWRSADGTHIIVNDLFDLAHLVGLLPTTR